jgi:hypothetical protein
MKQQINEIHRMQQLAGIITEESNSKMSSMQLIQNLDQEIIDKINDLKIEFPNHEFHLTNNSKWKPDREDLKGTYTLSVNGPSDDNLEKALNTL